MKRTAKKVAEPVVEPLQESSFAESYRRFHDEPDDQLKSMPAILASLQVEAALHRPEEIKAINARAQKLANGRLSDDKWSQEYRFALRREIERAHYFEGGVRWQTAIDNLLKK